MIIHVIVKGPVSRFTHQSFEDLGYAVHDFSGDGIIHYESLFDLHDRDYKRAEESLDELLSIQATLIDAFAVLSTGEVI